jgi:anti-sigma factor RsiW
MFDSVRSVQEIAARGPRAGAISPDLISDYVAGRLDPEDAELVEAAVVQDREVAAAVRAANRLASRMHRSWGPAAQGS